MPEFINTGSNRRAVSSGAARPPATDEPSGVISVAGIATASAGAVGASGGLSPSLPMIARLPRPLAKLANFGPEFMGSVLPRPSAPPPTVTPTTVSAPPTPQAMPHAQTIFPAEPDAPTITPWTTADITPEPPAAEPARPSSAPAKPTGKFKGFASRAQWRKFFADSKLRPFAHKKAHASKGGPKVRYRVLPERKGPPSAGSLR